MVKRLSTPVKLVVLIVLTIIFYIMWIYGLETAYTRLLLGGTNTVLSIVKKDTRIELEKESETYQFKVRTRIDGRKASFPQKIGGLLQSTVIILAWQLFLFIILSKRNAFRSLGTNLGLFYLAQILMLVLLSGFYTSEIQKYIYLMLMDSYYVIAIMLVIKDNILYPVFSKAKALA